MYGVLFCKIKQFLLVENQVAYGLVSKQGILQQPFEYGKPSSTRGLSGTWFPNKPIYCLIFFAAILSKYVAGKAIQHNTKKTIQQSCSPFPSQKNGTKTHGGPALPMDAEVAAPPSTFEAQAAALRSAWALKGSGSQVVTVPSSCANRLSCVCLFISGFWHSKSINPS
jgi:hypothetical protein